MAGGGAERQLTYLVKSQRELGLDVDVCLCNGGPNMERLRAAEVPVHQLGLRNNYDPFLLLKLVKLIRKLQPDIVQTWLLQMDVAGGLAALLTGVPFILSERCSAGAYSRSFKWLMRNFVARNSSAIIANSAQGLLYWKSIVKEQHPLFVVSNSIPIEEIYAAPQFYPENSAIPENVPRILFVGRLHPSKRIGLLLDVFKLALEQTSAILLICGQGEELGSLQSCVATDNQLSGRVFFLSYQSNSWGLMKTSDVFVSFSSYEGCPNAVTEAAVCGLPLFLSDIPEHRDIVGSNAWYLPDDLTNAADCLVKALDKSDENRAMTMSAVTALSCYDPHEIAHKVSQCYESVLLGTHTDKTSAI